MNQSVKTKLFSFLRKFSYIVFPVLITSIYIFLYNYKSISLDTDLHTTLIEVSATLLGFDFLLLTFINSFDGSKNFIKKLKEKQYFKNLTINIIVALIFYTLTIAVSIFEFNTFFSLLCFLIGLTNTGVACYFISQISFCLSK